MSGDVIRLPLPRKPLPYRSTAKALDRAAGIVRAYDVPDQAHVHVHGEGQCLTFDLSGCHKPAREMRYLSSALGVELMESPTETPDGCAAVELRCQTYTDGILLTVRATIPVPATWPAS